MEEIHRARRIYTNRTLNLKAIKAIGFDMDYTLIHYDVEAWERLAFRHALEHLAKEGWSVDGLEFDPDRVTQGLVVDTKLGNIVKANRFGFIKRALHGTEVLPYDQLRSQYSRVQVDLEESRWQFMNTLFSMSEGNLYAQLVDRMDKGEELPGIIDYLDLYRKVRRVVDLAHLEGHLKGAIMADPDAYVRLDPECALALQDLKHSGKRLLLITNSHWSYTRAMMSFAFDRYLPEGGWRQLFDVVIVDARKPSFFVQRNPAYEIATDDGLLRPWVRELEGGEVLSGGDAGLIEAWLKASGDEILYVGDHIYSDVHVSKSILRWRTGLILRELETEIEAFVEFEPTRKQLQSLMAEKENLERETVHLKTLFRRLEDGYGPPVAATKPELSARLSELKEKLSTLDERIGPLAHASASLAKSDWGPLFRTGNDKSHLARQIERSADIYTSRVSNFLHHGPTAYLRSARGSLPHEPTEDLG